MVWLWAAVAALLVVVVAALALRRRDRPEATTATSTTAEAPAPDWVTPIAAGDPAAEIALDAAVEPPPPPAPAPEPEPEPDDQPVTAVEAPPDPTAGGPGVPPPAGFLVKGSVGSRVFHTPDSPYFARTRAEVWFSSEEAAREAGFRRWDED